MSRVGAIVLFTVVPLLLVEGVLRVGFAERFRLPNDERVLTYQFDEELGWFPEPSSERTIEGTRPFRVRHNARGYRDTEHGAKERPRLLVLGDSFVWGFDVDEDERFTARLQERLPGWEVLNLGVSGYGTDQELLLLRRELAQYAPEIVLLVYAEENDRKDNSSNRRYGPYYKPYFVRGVTGLEQRGTPVPTPLPYLARQHPWLFQSLVVRAASQA
ncbi:MAG: SGNH/GDSL hydrolase family protein, partial [Myxococcota bacterium]